MNECLSAQDVTDVAVVIPCFNEALSIGMVLNSFREHLPGARLYVFDNQSTDETASIAKAEGAEVIHVKLRGKGNVVRRMFADIDADIYVMVDGDATYEIAHIKEHIAEVQRNRIDMLVGCRKEVGHDDRTYRPGHRFGNQMLTSTVAWIFGGNFSDMLSGYRVFSRRFVKSFPAAAHGFETETELTVHALELRMPIAEVPVAYYARPEGSFSKLSTYRDGVRILKTIIKLFVSERPLAFFSIISGVLALLALVLAEPIFAHYLVTGEVPRFPTAVLSTGLMICGLMSLVCGLILNNVTIGRQEAKYQAYLNAGRSQ